MEPGGGGGGRGGGVWGGRGEGSKAMWEGGGGGSLKTPGALHGLVNLNKIKDLFACYLI